MKKKQLKSTEAALIENADNHHKLRQPTEENHQLLKDLELLEESWLEISERHSNSNSYNRDRIISKA